MAIKTAIEWCDSTVNPMMGCDGCELWKPGDGGTCYAGVDVTKKGGANAGMPAEFHKPEIYPYRLLDALKWPDLTGTERPDKPWLNGLPRTIFLNDYGDTYTRSLDSLEYLNQLMVSVANEEGPRRLQEIESRRLFGDAIVAVAAGGHWLDSFIPLMEASPHIWLLLTKRPGRMRRAFARHGRVPRNFWPMTSITRAGQLGRVRQLLAIGDEQTIRGISFEPIYEAVDFGGLLKGISWLILGGESGRDAKPCRLGWIDFAVKHGKAAGCHIFVKQLGANAEAFTPRTSDPRYSDRIYLRDPKGGDPSEWPGGLERFPREMPKPIAQEAP